MTLRPSGCGSGLRPYVRHLLQLVEQERELAQLVDAGKWAIDRGLLLHMGHGLTYRNVTPVARIAGVSELNIGHSIVARAVLVGFERAVREMKALVAD